MNFESEIPIPQPPKNNNLIDKKVAAEEVCVVLKKKYDITLHSIIGFIVIGISTTFNQFVGAAVMALGAAYLVWNLKKDKDKIIYFENNYGIKVFKK